MTTGWRNIAGGVWHGAFLATALAFANVSVVVPAFVAELTGSSIWVGGLAALLAVTASGPQILVARFVEPLPRKRPVLLGAIYLRALSWAALALLIASAGEEHPQVVLIGLIGTIAVFAAGGAIGSVPFADIVGKVIPPHRRGSFFAGRQAAGSLLGFGAAAVSGVVLARPYPENFATLFLLSALALAISSLGIWAIREPPAHTASSRLSWRDYFASLKEPLAALRSLAVVSWATGFGWLAVPFYVVVARRELGVSDQATAWFVGASVAGALVGNVSWGWIVDRYDSRHMILACVIVATLTPLLALLAPTIGWQVLVVATGLTGATTTGKIVGYSSAVLELAPADRRSSYAGTFALLSLPTAFMPLIGGAIASATSFQTLFVVTACALVIAVAVVWWWNRDRSDSDFRLTETE